MNANVDTEVVLLGLLLETANKRRVGDGFAKVVRFIRRSSNVIGGFREEENLY